MKWYLKPRGYNARLYFTRDDKLFFISPLDPKYGEQLSGIRIGAIPKFLRKLTFQDFLKEDYLEEVKPIYLKSILKELATNV